MTSEGAKARFVVESEMRWLVEYHGLGMMTSDPMSPTISLNGLRQKSLDSSMLSRL